MIFKFKALTAVLLMMASMVSAIEMPNTIKTSALSQKLAMKAVEVAVAECTKKGFKVAASLVGRDGLPLAFLRNPLAGAHTIKVSERKAYTAASLQAATSEMASRQDLNYAPGILLIVGGVPISIAGDFYGGIAVAGADPAIDEECALAGVAAITEIIEFGDM